jgi:hypothetical protein
MLRALRISLPIHIVELEGILTYVRRRGLSYPWVGALRRRVLLSRVTMPIERAIGWPELKARARSVLHGARRASPASALLVKGNRV